MSFQFSCAGCGNILQDQIPLLSKDGSMELNCPDCEQHICIFYGPEHNFTKYMNEKKRDDDVKN